LSKQKGFGEYVGEYQDYFHQVVEMANREKQEVANHFSWKDVRINDLKEKFDNCTKCTYYQMCEGVWKGYATQYGTKEFIPVT
jgi:radical SAM protein with 4Fe4S-binding SPASM domain